MKRHIIPILAAALPFAAHALTPEVFVGTWCYSHYDAGGERHDQNIVYRINEDGTLFYQNTPDSPVDRPGSWSFDGDTLKLKPTFMAFTLTVTEQTEARLVFSGLGDHVFRRGECP